MIPEIQQKLSILAASPSQALTSSTQMRHFITQIKRISVACVQITNPPHYLIPYAKCDDTHIKVHTLIGTSVTSLVPSAVETTFGGAMSKSTAVSPRLCRYCDGLPVGCTARGIGPQRHTCLNVLSSYKLRK